MNRLLTVGVSCICLALGIGIGFSKRGNHSRPVITTGGYIPITAPSSQGAANVDEGPVHNRAFTEQGQSAHAHYSTMSQKDGQTLEGDIILNEPYSVSEPWSTYRLEGLYTTQDAKSLAGNRRWKGVDIFLDPMPNEGDTTLHWKTKLPLSVGNRSMAHLWFMVLLIHPDQNGGFDAASGHAYNLALSPK